MRKCGLCKTAFWALAVAAGVVGAGYIFGFGSHMRTAVRSAVRHVQREVPPEFEIARIRNELSQIEPDIRKNLSGLAEEMVAVENLKNDVADRKVNLEKQKKLVLEMKKDVESGARTISYSGLDLTVSEVRDRLAREFDSYKVAEAATKAKEEELKARQRGLDAAKEKIVAMRAAKEQLEAELAKAEAELKLVQLTEVNNKYQVDDSRLSGIKQSMKGLKDRIKAMKQQQDLEAQFTHEQVMDRVEQKVKSNEVLKEIDAHFGHEDGRTVTHADSGR